MSDYVIWFVVALGLVIAEIFTGTFYLLTLGIGAAAGGLAALLGASQTTQLAVGAAVGIAAVLGLRRTRWGRLNRGGSATTNPDIQLDVGQTVQVTQWSNGRARIQYRGAQWDAVLEPGAPAVSGTQVIKAVQGSTLVLAPAAQQS